MADLFQDESRVNVSMPVELLARLMATKQLCAADLVSLDSESHHTMRRLLLTLCAQQLKGHAPECEGCLSQSYCQQLTAEGLPQHSTLSSLFSWRLH